MTNLVAFVARVKALADELGVPYTIAHDEQAIMLVEAKIPVKGYRVFAAYEGQQFLVAEGRAPYFQIVRLYLSSLVARGTPRFDITNGRSHDIAAFFGLEWLDGLTGENAFLFGIHVGSYIEFDWD